MRKGLATMVLLLALVTVATGVFASGQGGGAAGGGEWKFPYKGPEITLTLFEAGSDVEGMMNRMVNKEIVKRLGNIKWDITVLPIEDYDTKLALMYASGDLFDINGVRDPQKQTNAYGASGVFLDYEKYKNIMPNFQAEVKKRPWFNYMLNPDGTRYGLPGQNYDKDFLMEAWAYNKTIHDRYKIKVPDTSAEMMANMKAMKKANPAIYPFVYIWELKWLPDTIAGMFGKYPPQGLYYNEELKTWIYGPMDSRSQYKETLQYMNEMWMNDLFDPEQVTHNVEQYFATTQKGLWGYTFMYAGQTVAGQMRKNDSDYEIAGMYVPKGPRGDAWAPITVAQDQMNYWGVVSSSKTKYPELVCAILDWMWSAEAFELFNWGVEGVTFKRNADGTRAFLPEFKTATNPNGTKNHADYMVPFLPFAYLSDVSLSMLTSYNTDSYNLIRKAIDGLVSGRNTGPYMNPIFPLLTSEEGAQVASIMNPIETYVNENAVKFIRGLRSFDTWDQFVADIKKLGDIDWVIKLYNGKKTPTHYARNYKDYWK